MGLFRKRKPRVMDLFRKRKPRVMDLFRKRKPRVAEVVVEPNGVHSVTCPYCKAYMRHIYKVIVLMRCWNCGEIMELKRKNEDN